VAIIMTVTSEGPLFDGTAAALAARGVHAVREELADHAERLANATFTAAIRNDHGVFTGQFTETDTTKVYEWGSSWTRDRIHDHPAAGRVRVSRTYSMPITVAGTDVEMVTNRLAVYGPWLEGTGSRNETTRFKGYHGMRLASELLEATADADAQAALVPYVEEMNL
jgi:hypothetical protein